MANETINLATAFSGFNSGTDLQPRNTRTNNQAVTINDIAGFIQVSTSAPATTSGNRGDIKFSLSDNKLYVCRDSFGTLEVGTVLAGIPTAVSGATAGTYNNVALNGGSGTGLTATIVMASATSVTSITIDAIGTGYNTGDVLVINAGEVGATSTSFTITLVAADTAAVYKSVALA